MGGQNKMLIPLADRPVLCHTVSRFQNSPLVEAVAVTAPEDQVEEYRQLFNRFGFTKVRWVIAGGDERQHSIYNALIELPAEPEDWVAIHDGARPFVTEPILQRLLLAAPKYRNGGVLPTVAVKDTIKRGSSDGAVLETLPREELFAAQTPQMFRFETILQAHKAAKQQGLLATDDCALVEAEGGVIGMVEGDYRNFKVTTPEDIKIAQVWVEDFVG